MDETLRLLSRSPEATHELGRLLGGALCAGSLVALDGDLGAGKTVFVKGIAAGLGVRELVTSPSFTLMKEYRGRLPLFHFDAWMEGRERAFLEGGGEEALFGEGVSVVEWGSRVESHLPLPHLLVRLAHESPPSGASGDAGLRTIRVSLVCGPGGQAGPLGGALEVLRTLDGFPELSRITELPGTRETPGGGQSE